MTIEDLKEQMARLFENLKEEIARLLNEVTILENEAEEYIKIGYDVEKIGHTIDFELFKLLNGAKFYKTEVDERRGLVESMSIPELESFKNTLKEYVKVLGEITAPQKVNLLTPDVEEKSPEVKKEEEKRPRVKVEDVDLTL